MSETTKALFKDALYQVLDNKVFRLLVILILFMVLPTFLIAAKPDELVILFGWKTYNYKDVFETFSLPYPGIDAEAHATLIQSVQKLLVEQIAGTFGLIFAIAATAFFVPRMVEKGAADTIFSKPVSRSALLFSRYVAGLLFVAILATVLVVGMHIGLLLNSGYSDPGFLWSIPVMAYKYAILHAFSLMIAVWTRSSVAAILTTLMFFAFNGCVHSGWEVKEMQQERRKILISAEAETEADDPSKLIDALLVTLDTLHYVLPKTSDAALISQKLRRAIAERGLAFKDNVTGLKIAELPKGFTAQAVSESDLPTIAVWTHSDGVGRLTLKRWDYKQRKQKKALEELDKQLADMGIHDVRKDREWAMNTRADSRSWSEPRGELRVLRKTVFAVGRGFLFEIQAELREDAGEPEAAADESVAEPEKSAKNSDRDAVQGVRPAQPVEPGGVVHESEPAPKAAVKTARRGGRERDRFDEFDDFLRSFEQAGAPKRDPQSFMEDRVRWGGELKYNLYFSVASTLAFIALLLGLSFWKLSRIDF